VRNACLRQANEKGRIDDRTIRLGRVQVLAAHLDPALLPVTLILGSYAIPISNRIVARNIPT
jgi:hypothetical protein